MTAGIRELTVGVPDRLPKLVVDELPPQVFLVLQVYEGGNQHVVGDASKPLRDTAALAEQGSVRVEEIESQPGASTRRAVLRSQCSRATARRRGDAKSHRIAQGGQLQILTSAGSSAGIADCIAFGGGISRACAGELLANFVAIYFCLPVMSAVSVYGIPLNK